MARKQLPKREIEICARLRGAREYLGVTQPACADAIGLQRSTLANYENGITPLRYEIALRFCRHLFISEEWLATGDHAAMRKSAVAHGFSADANFGNLEEIFRRQCMDLLSDPICLQIASGSLYSEAFDKVLSPRYAQLALSFFHYPRLVLSDYDKVSVHCNYMLLLLNRWLRMLGNEALRLSKSQPAAQRAFTWAMIEVGDVTFKRFFGFSTPEVKKPAMAWLRTMALSPDAPLGPLHGIATENFQENDLTQYPQESISSGVKPIMPKLLERLRKATAERGQQAKLAETLGVSPQKVNDWLSGRVEPSGETTLRLLHWVELQERKT